MEYGLQRQQNIELCVLELLQFFFIFVIIESKTQRNTRISVVALWRDLIFMARDVHTVDENGVKWQTQRPSLLDK